MLMKKLLPFFGLLGMIVAVLLIFFTAVNGIDSGHSEEDAEQLTLSLRRAAASCYASEGAYPEDLAYLEEYYGIQIDSRRYSVIYRPIASNLMPEITVIQHYDEK